MKKIVLYGAFDRYNYGDNLMPIILKKFIETYRPELLKDYELEFSAITHSDLSHYCCLKTRPINEVLKELESETAVIVVGGEVVGAKREILFLHSFKNQIIYKFFRSLKWRLPSLYLYCSRFLFSNVSELPYVIIDHDVRLFFNTVGGRVTSTDYALKQKSLVSLKSAEHLSVRDRRTESGMENFADPILVPDSVHAITKLINDKFLKEHISNKVLPLVGREYVVFQASPIKLSTPIHKLVSAIKELHKVSGERIVLLPIGYATGHDDGELMAELNSRLPEETLILSDLNLWEIMFVIKNANAFYGTSLHGIITAFAFGKPHFCINKNIDKVNAYIKDWSIFPYNRSIEPEAMASTLRSEKTFEALERRAEELADLVIKNSNTMFDKLQG